MTVFDSVFQCKESSDNGKWNFKLWSAVSGRMSRIQSLSLMPREVNSLEIFLPLPKEDSPQIATSCRHSITWTGVYQHHNGHPIPILIHQWQY